MPRLETRVEGVSANANEPSVRRTRARARALKRPMLPIINEAAAVAVFCAL